MRLEPVGVLGDERFERDARGFDVVGRHLQRRDLIPRRRIAGTHVQRALEELRGLVETLILLRNHAEIDVRRVVVRIGFQLRLELLACLVAIAAGDERQAVHPVHIR